MVALIDLPKLCSLSIRNCRIQHTPATSISRYHLALEKLHLCGVDVSETCLRHLLSMFTEIKELELRQINDASEIFDYQVLHPESWLPSCQAGSPLQVSDLVIVLGDDNSASMAQVVDCVTSAVAENISQIQTLELGAIARDNSVLEILQTVIDLCTGVTRLLLHIDWEPLFTIGSGPDEALGV